MLLLCSKSLRKKSFFKFLRSLIMIRTQHLKIQNGGFNTAAIFAKIRRFRFKLYKNEYKKVFEVADYDSEVKNLKNSK